MEFFCYHRDRPHSTALREELTEQHWSYMDGFADGMIARGPTLTDDGRTATGSVHIVDLPDVASARAFALDEPNHQAGVYRDVLLRRWRDVLGRTMWQVPGGRGGDPHFLLVALGAGPAVDVEPPGERDAWVAYGPLLADDGRTWLGTGAIVRAPDAHAARGLLSAERYAVVEVHPWTYGGRR